MKLIGVVFSTMPKQHLTSNAINVFNLTFLIVCVGLGNQLGISKVTSSECGKVEVLAPQIFYGKQTYRGEWPFLAALHFVQGMQFFCGGTLISSKHVLTGKFIPVLYY